jgi:hypothetical protein
MTPAQCQVILGMHIEARGGPKAPPLGRSASAPVSDGADLFALAAMTTR